MKKVFIDGSAGTTGLRINERLSERGGISLITLPEKKRKDADARKDAINSADIVFLCLPDDAAREAVAMCENPDTVIFDTSTAHRTAQGWTYGFPEISENGFEKVKSSKRIAVPGCHASGFIALVKPLVDYGFVDKSACLSCFSLTGYSGGGKKMIKQYEDTDDGSLVSPRQYGLSQQHKHLAEMKAVCTLESAPVFCPVVSSYYSGMEVTVPLFATQLLTGGAEEIKKMYADIYSGEIVRYTENADNDGFLSAGAMSGKDGMKISVFGNEERMILTARYDNLGKGASGAAIECLNIVTGEKITEGLVL